MVVGEGEEVGVRGGWEGRGEEGGRMGEGEVSMRAFSTSAAVIEPCGGGS